MSQLKIEVKTQIFSTETVSKVKILTILELIELILTNAKMKKKYFFFWPTRLAVSSLALLIVEVRSLKHVPHEN